MPDTEEAITGAELPEECRPHLDLLVHIITVLVDKLGGAVTLTSAEIEAAGPLVRVTVDEPNALYHLTSADDVVDSEHTA